MKINGTFTALITPMKKNGEIDFEGFRKNLCFQFENGIDGLVPLGTTSETPTLSEEEEEALIKIVMEEKQAFQNKSGKKMPVILGAGSNNTLDAVRYCKRAQNAGADAALVVTPYYNKPSQQGIINHFKAVSQVGIPILVYNIAGRTGVNIATETLEKIASLPNIAGVKEASGNINQMMEVIFKIKSKNPNFCVLSGDDALTLPLLALGGDGVVSVVSNLFPKKICDMVNACLGGDFDLGKKLHYELLPIFKAAFVDGNPSSIKYAMNAKGLFAGAVRAPLAEVCDDAKKIIENALSQIGI